MQGVPPLLEAHVSAAAQHSDAAEPTDARLNKVYGARASYINNTLMSGDAEYLHYFCIWLVVFAAVIYSLHRIMKSTMTSKQSKQACEQLERAFSLPEETTNYAELAASHPESSKAADL